MQPIPKRMLKNQATIKLYEGNAGEGPTYSEEIDLTHIKIEEKKVFTTTRDGSEVIGNATMFYDCKNSKGLSEVPTQNSEITFGGRTYKVVEADVLRGNSAAPHHYEVILK